MLNGRDAISRIRVGNFYCEYIILRRYEAVGAESRTNSSSGSGEVQGWNGNEQCRVASSGASFELGRQGGIGPDPVHLSMTPPQTDASFAW